MRQTKCCRIYAERRYKSGTTVIHRMTHISPNIKKQFPYQCYSICSTAMDGVAARGIVNGRVAATIIFVIFACGRFI